MTESGGSSSGLTAEFRASTDALKLGVGWTVLALLVLIAGYGSVRVCPLWGDCKKGALFVGWKPLILTAIVWMLGIAALRLASSRLEKRPAAAEVEDETAPPRPARSGMTFLLCALVTLAVPHLFLLSPMTARPFWAYPVRLSDHLGFPLNWDSQLLMDLALSPEKVLEPGAGSLRQSRPVYVWFTAGLTQVLAPLARASGLADLYGVRHPAFLPEVVLNWGLLTLAFFLFWRLLLGFGGPFARYAAPLAAVPFLANDVVKAFFWTPHMQLFNLLVPLLGVLLCRSVLAGPVFSLWKTLCVGLGLGALSLAYESSLFILPAIAAAFFLRAKPAQAGAWRREALRTGLLGLGFALPHLVWIGATVVRTGRYRQLQFQGDRAFAWLLDSLSAGVEETVTRMFSYLVLFLRTLGAACGLLIGCGVFLLFIGFWLGARSSPANSARRQTLRAASLTLFSAITFLYLMGQYLERHSFFLAPVLLVLCGLWLTQVLERSSRQLRVLLCGGFGGMALVWVVYEIVKYGPYS